MRCGIGGAQRLHRVGRVQRLKRPRRRRRPTQGRPRAAGALHRLRAAGEARRRALAAGAQVGPLRDRRLGHVRRRQLPGRRGPGAAGRRGGAADAGAGTAIHSGSSPDPLAHRHRPRRQRRLHQGGAPAPALATSGGEAGFKDDLRILQAPLDDLDVLRGDRRRGARQELGGAAEFREQTLVLRRQLLAQVLEAAQQLQAFLVVAAVHASRGQGLLKRRCVGASGASACGGLPSELDLPRNSSIPLDTVRGRGHAAAAPRRRRHGARGIARGAHARRRVLLAASCRVVSSPRWRWRGGSAARARDGIRPLRVRALLLLACIPGIPRLPVLRPNQRMLLLRWLLLLRLAGLLRKLLALQCFAGRFAL
mmetsp:Transcript_123863/g.396525  ORF Transcript_123863/g.396525 Transcript_123863/m.396525 type:complete len:366 (-) Transcript_123863:2559-3656(-)